VTATEIGGLEATGSPNRRVFHVEQGRVFAEEAN
jgi:hypothetical protein